MTTTLLSKAFDPSVVEGLAKAFPSVRFVRLNPDWSVPDDARDAEILIRMMMMKPQVQQVLDSVPTLRWLHSFAAGADHWYVPEIGERGIVVTRTTAHSAPIAEFVLALMLHVTKQLPKFAADQARHEWSPPETIEQLERKTVGIVGTGSIGGEIARRCRALGMRVIGVRRHADRPAEHFDEILSMDELPRFLSASDYVVLAAPATAATQGMIGGTQLRAMRPTAYLINVARGSLIVEADLVRALREGWIAGACLDALVGEPIGKESPMWDVPNLVITPHSAFRSPHGIERSLSAFKTNLERYLRGEPLQDVLDVSAGY